MSKDKSRKHESFSQWTKRNKALLKEAQGKITEPQHGGQRWRKSRRYQTWRSWCMTRDYHHCQWCGATKDLSVHHIIPAAICPELRYDVRNGITLCRECHERGGERIHQMRPRFWKNAARKRTR